MSSVFIRAGLYSATAALVACSASVGVPTQPTEIAGPAVRLVYAAPQDRSYRADYAEGIASAFQDLQSWYREELDGVTFSLFQSSPEYCVLPNTADYYRDDTWTRLMTDVQGCIAISYDSPNFRWAFYADVMHTCNAPGRIGAASRGVTIMGRVDLEGLTGTVVANDCGNTDNMPVGRWRGGAGHELAHTFGLPHPPGCAEGLTTCDRGSLMWLGYRTYPETYFGDDEKAKLRTSPFIR